MKTFKIIVTIIFLIILSQSCKNVFFDKYTKVHGYVKEEGTDKGIENVKLEVERIETTTLKKDILDVIDYSDNKGYFELKFKWSSDYSYRLKPTHENYIFVILEGQMYPVIYAGKETEQNLEMVKQGKVKIEGDVRHWHDGTFTRLVNAKVSVLKRKIGNTSYPEATGVNTFTNTDGKFYIEYEGNKGYEFFLKPEKEGYYYDKGSIIKDCGNTKNFDTGYVISYGFDLSKKNKQ